MKRSGKRIISLLTAAVLSLGLLTGCGDKKNYGKDVITLRWVTFGTSVPDDLQKVVDKANEYSAEKIGIVVDLEIQPSEMLNLIMASGEYYDMIFTSTWANVFNNQVAKGMFYDISGIVEEETPELYASIGEYWEAAEYNGGLYAVPTLKDMGSEMMFRLNSDYFEKEKGMTIPETMDFADLEPYLEAYKKDFPHKYPLGIDKSGVAGYSNLQEPIIGNIIGIPYDLEKPEPVAFWDNENVMSKFRLLHKWYTLGYINPDVAAMEFASIDHESPVRCGVAWRGYLGYSNPADWGFNVKTSIYAGPYISKATEQGAMTAICAGCSEERARAALRYLELLGTDSKFRDILAYGIEGEHFNYLENGTILRTQRGSDCYYTSLYQTGSVVRASVESVSKDFLNDPDQWTKVFEGYKEYGIRSRSEGFVYDQSRHEDIVATINAIYQNYSTDLVTGTSDPDVIIPKMKAEMEEAGLEELMEDIRSELDKHLAENEGSQ